MTDSVVDLLIDAHDDEMLLRVVLDLFWSDADDPV